MYTNNRKKLIPKKDVLAIGVYSSRKNTGISNNFDVLINGLKARNASFLTVKIPARLRGAIGSFHFLHGIKVIRSIICCWVKMLFCRNICHQVAFSLLGFFRDLLIIWPAALLGKKVFIRVHTGGYGIFYLKQSKFAKSLIRATLKKTHRIIVLGESLRQQFDFTDTLLQKTVVVPNGIEIPGRPTNISKKSYSKKSLYKILYLSNLIESKGYLDLLKACQLMLEGGDENFFCDFCGDFITIADEKNDKTPYEREQDFKQFIKDWHLVDHVAYHGSVTGISKNKFLKEAHVFVLPTNYLWEGQPLSIIEALSFGLPIISTDYRAIPDQVIDGYNGFMVNFGQPEELKNALLRLQSNSANYQKMSMNALSLYKEKFTQQKHLDLLIPIITH